MTKEPCIHLNALITNPNKNPQYESTQKYSGTNVDKAYYDSGAGFILPKGVENRSYEFQFRRKMEKVGLLPLTVDILVLRYIYSLSLREIETELGIVSVSTVHRLHKEALALIKKRGLPDEMD